MDGAAALGASGGGALSKAWTDCSQRPKTAAARLICSRWCGRARPPTSFLKASSTASFCAGVTLSTLNFSMSDQKLTPC